MGAEGAIATGHEGEVVSGTAVAGGFGNAKIDGLDAGEGEGLFFDDLVTFGNAAANDSENVASRGGFDPVERAGGVAEEEFGFVVEDASF